VEIQASEPLSNDARPSIAIERRHLNRWAEMALRVNHLNTLVQREIQGGSLTRARALSERSRVAACAMFNELLTAGAESAAIDPEYPYVHWHRGLAAEALGRPEEARKQFDAFAQGLAAVGKTPPDVLATAIQEKLRQYELEDLYGEPPSPTSGA
jgi:hypothetical protein